MTRKDLKIIILSDGTGETASLMTKAAAMQFTDKDVSFTRYKNIRTKVQVESIFQDAALKHDLVVYTIVSSELRNFIVELSDQLNVPSIDLLGPLLSSLSSYFESQPLQKPGAFHEVNDNYFKRIAAMEYTIQHDDGKNLAFLDESDIIILGISRTSKTPLSMYLSLQGWRVCNIPLVNGIPLPSEIFQADQNKIIGLTIQAEVLHAIRKARLERLGQDPYASSQENYASMDHIVQDIEYANDIFKQNKRWPVFDVSGKALEETATEIVKLIIARRRLSDRNGQRT